MNKNTNIGEEIKESLCEDDMKIYVETKINLEKCTKIKKSKLSKGRGFKTNIERQLIIFH